MHTASNYMQIVAAPEGESPSDMLHFLRPDTYLSTFQT